MAGDQDLPRSAAHPLYSRLNQILDQHHFDRFVEGLAGDSTPRRAVRGCRPAAFSAAADRLFRRVGRRARDRVAYSGLVCAARVLGLVLPDPPPDHSTISRTRRLIDLETHEAVFTWMVQRLAAGALGQGRFHHGLLARGIA